MWMKFKYGPGGEFDSDWLASPLVYFCSIPYHRPIIQETPSGRPSSTSRASCTRRPSTSGGAYASKVWLAPDRKNVNASHGGQKPCPIACLMRLSTHLSSNTRSKHGGLFQHAQHPRMPCCLLCHTRVRHPTCRVRTLMMINHVDVRAKLLNMDVTRR